MKQRILEDNETSKGCFDNSVIMLRGDNEMITDDKRLAKLFNEHYINIVERSCDLKPVKKKIACPNEDFHSVKKYGNRSSIIKINNNMSEKLFEF